MKQKKVPISHLRIGEKAHLPLSGVMIRLVSKGGGSIKVHWFNEDGSKEDRTVAPGTLVIPDKMKIGKDLAAKAREYEQNRNSGHASRPDRSSPGREAKKKVHRRGE
jgi:hypothetical protein